MAVIDFHSTDGSRKTGREVIGRYKHTISQRDNFWEALLEFVVDIRQDVVDIPSQLVTNYRCVIGGRLGCFITHGMLQLHGL